MNNQIDLTGFTFMLLAVAVFVPMYIHAATHKKTWLIRGAIIAAVLLLYVTVVGINLRPIPANGDTTVYITRTGSKYHNENCRHLSQSKIETTLKNAIADGYSDCSHCSTPDYIPEDITPKFTDLYGSQGLLTIGITVAVCVALYGIPAICVCFSERRKR